MGRYLSCGIATNLTIKKNYYNRGEVFEKIKDEINLDIYRITEDENMIYLDIKEKVFEDYAIDFILEQLDSIKEKSKHVYEALEELEQVKGKSYNELIDISKEKSIYTFQFMEGSLWSNDISYLCDDLEIHADVISYILDGKIIIESYYELFRYFREKIIKTSNSPIKTACVVLTIG